MFVITNGDYYIAQVSNGLKPVKTIEDAIQFDKKNKANNFASSMPRTFKNLGYNIKEITVQKTEVPRISDISHKKIFASVDNVTNNGEIQEIKNRVSDFEKFLEKLKAQKQECYNRVGVCDKKLVDIMHKAEFYNLNAADGYEVYRQLRDVRRERRIAKNKIAAINAIFEDNNFDGILTQKTSGRISGLENQMYSVRELDEIFPDD